MEHSIFPEIKIVRVPKKVLDICGCLGGVSMLPQVTDLSTSEHIRREVDPRPEANSIVN